MLKNGKSYSKYCKECVLPTPTEAIHVDPDLLESRLRIARMMANDPLTDEPGA